MALVLNQEPVTSSASLIAVVPPNSTVTLSVPTGAATVYVGQTTAVTASSGFPINPGGPQVNFSLPPTSQTVSIYAIVVSTSSVLGVAITSTA